jgi:hypothetical protein
LLICVAKADFSKGVVCEKAKTQKTQKTQRPFIAKDLHSGCFMSLAIDLAQKPFCFRIRPLSLVVCAFRGSISPFPQFGS